jgi:hypothetical protein
VQQPVEDGGGAAAANIRSIRRAGSKRSLSLATHRNFTVLAAPLGAGLSLGMLVSTRSIAKADRGFSGLRLTHGGLRRPEPQPFVILIPSAVSPMV